MLRPGRIGQADRFEGHFAARRHRQEFRLGGCADRGLGGQNLAKALGGAGGLREFAVDLRKLPQGARAEYRVEHELRELARRHRAGQHPLGAVPHHPDDAGGDEEDRDAGEQGARLHRVTSGRIGILGSLPEMLRRGATHAEGLHGANRPDRLRRIGRGVGEPVLRRAGTPPHAASGQDQREHDERDRHENQDRQFGTGDDHHHHRADEQEGVSQQDRDGDPEHGLDLGRVGGEPGDDLARLRAVEESGIEDGEAGEDRAAQVRDHALTQRHHGVVPGGTRQGEHRHHADQSHEVSVDDAVAFGREAVSITRRRAIGTTRVATEAESSDRNAARMRPR